MPVFTIVADVDPEVMLLPHNIDHSTAQYSVQI
jgi:hypothetical protein